MMQVEPCNHQAKDKRDADWEATTKRKWAKTKTVKNNSFEISTQNRFSYWEEEDTNEPVLSMIGEIKTEKITVIEGTTRENKVKVKKQKQKVETITSIMGDDFPENFTSKVKCRQCGHKKGCKEPNSCKAVNKFCSFCFKPNHFPKSLNCKKKRKLKQKRKHDGLTKEFSYLTK